MVKDFDNEEIRDAVRRLCGRVPGGYLRKREADRACQVALISTDLIRSDHSKHVLGMPGSY